MEAVLRDVTAADLAAVLTINEAQVPKVARIPIERVQWFTQHAHTFRVAVLDEQIVGFLIALTPEAAYDSIHFGWFRKQYDRFLYVDRIALAAAAQQRGIGRRLYGDLAAVARREGHERITAEVNIDPPNDASLAFHRTLGFTEVGTQDASGGKRVVLLAQPIQ
ncbi:MAG: GNAT family N-acetyltransferase [Planctomycetota bacterium]